METNSSLPVSSSGGALNIVNEVADMQGSQEAHALVGPYLFDFMLCGPNNF